MRGTQAVVCALAGVTGLVSLVGCGDDGDTGTASAAPLTKAEFVKQANTICKRGNAGIEAKAQKLLTSVGKKPLRIVSEEMVEEAVAPGFETEIRQIRALEVPAGDGKEVEAILIEMEAVVDRMRREPLGVQRTSTRSPYRPGMRLATRYGIGACARPYVQ